MTFFPPLLIIVTALTVCVSLLFLIGLFRVRTGRNVARPFVSVVVAARNEEAYVGACLEALGRSTFACNVVDSGPAAIESVRHRTPDVVITDYKLGGGVTGKPFDFGVDPPR